MFLDEIAARLVAQNVGVIGTNIFLSSRAVIPSGAGPYLTLIETGGVAVGLRNRVQNRIGMHVQTPGAQVLVRAATYQSARLMAKSAYNALDGIWNTTLSGVFYQSVTARQEPTDLGVEDGRVVVVFNIDAVKQPS